MTTRQLALKAPPSLNINEGSSDFVLGAKEKGAWAWSAFDFKPLYWDGAQWRSTEITVRGAWGLPEKPKEIRFTGNGVYANSDGTEVMTVDINRTTFSSGAITRATPTNIVFEGVNVNAWVGPENVMTVNVGGRAKPDVTPLYLEDAAFGHAFLWLPIEAAPNSVISCSLVPNSEWDADDLVGYSVSGAPSNGGIEFCVSCDGPIMGFFTVMYTIYT